MPSIRNGPPPGNGGGYDSAQLFQTAEGAWLLCRARSIYCSTLAPDPVVSLLSTQCCGSAWCLCSCFYRRRARKEQQYYRSSFEGILQPSEDQAAKRLKILGLASQLFLSLLRTTAFQFRSVFTALVGAIHCLPSLPHKQLRLRLHQDQEGEGNVINKCLLCLANSTPTAEEPSTSGRSP